VEGMPEGAPPPPLDEEPQLTAPGIGAVDQEMLKEIAKRLSA
jgi:Mn-containing catalase